MSVLQKIKIHSTERLDLPDLKNIENFACADWAQFFDKFMSNQSMVIQGFDISGPQQLCGAAASSGVSINIANAVMFHPTSSNAGGGFFVASPTEAAELVSLSQSATNYIEMDQTVETGGADIRKFWSPDTSGGEGQEFSQIVDTVTYLKTEITSNTVGFTDGKIPIAKIVTTTTIQSITDCRPMFFRLGTGGTSPNPLYDHEWVDVPTGSARVDSPITVTAASPAGTNPFKGSDKNLRHFKDWMNAVMSSIKEMRGTSHWFSSGGFISGATLANLWWDTVGSQITGQGDFQHDSGTPGRLIWTSDIIVKSIIGNYQFVIPAGNVTLTNEQIAYVLLERNQPLSSGSDLDWVNGVSYVNGSTGAFTGLIVGDWIKKTIDGVEQYVEITDFHANLNGGGAGGQPPATALSVAIATNYGGTTGSDKAVYAKGSYTPTVVDRATAPNNADVWRLALCSNSGGATLKLYLRSGMELEPGEEVEISDTTSLDLFTFVGSTGESDSDPDYDGEAVATGAKTGTQSYNSTNGENLMKRSSLLTSMMADKAQDKSVSIREGGDLVWTAATGIFTAASNIIVSIPSSSFNNYVTPAGIATALGATSLSNAGDCIYFVINRNSGALEDISVSLVVDTEDNVPHDENTFVLAHRGTDDNLYFMDGTRCVDGEINHIGGRDFFEADSAFITVVDDVTHATMDGDFLLSAYADASECIQAAVDSIKDTTGGKIYIRTGNYQLTEAISFEEATKDIEIMGDGAQTILNMPNVAAVQESFVAGAGETPANGEFAVAAGTSLTVGDIVEINDDNSASLTGWVTNIAAGGGAGGEDIITVSWDSAGASDIDLTNATPAGYIYTVSNNAFAKTYTGAAFVVPKDVDNLHFEKFKVTNSHGQTNRVFWMTNCENITIKNIIAEDLEDVFVTIIGTHASGGEAENITISNNTLSFNCDPAALCTCIDAFCFVRRVSIHHNKMTGTANAGIALTANHVIASIREDFSIHDNHIELDVSNPGAKDGFGFFSYGRIIRLNLHDNTIVLMNAGAAVRKRGIEFDSGPYTVDSIYARAVIADNYVSVYAASQHANDACLWIENTSGGSREFNDIVVTGNQFQGSPSTMDYCVRFNYVIQFVLDGNRIFGGDTKAYYITNSSSAGFIGANLASGNIDYPDDADLDHDTSFNLMSQIVKVWGNMECGGGGAVTVHNNWNVESASYSFSNLTVNFRRDFTTTRYSPVGNSSTQPSASIGVFSLNVGSCLMANYDISSGSSANWVNGDDANILIAGEN